jgi:hypothetical protein
MIVTYAFTPGTNGAAIFHPRSDFVFLHPRTGSCAKISLKVFAMRTLFFVAPSSRKDQTAIRSDLDGEMTGVSVTGTVLANRYKILEKVGADSFKAHDLLDQNVSVSQTILTSGRAGDAWRQKISNSLEGGIVDF